MFPLRNLDGIEDIVDNIFGGNVLRFRLIGNGDAVPENVVADSPDIFGDNIPAPLDEGVGLAGESEVNACPGRAAVADEGGKLVELKILGGACGENDIENISLDFLIHIDVLQDGACFQY